MPSLRERTQPLAVLCRAVPGLGQGVCPVCRGCPRPGYAVCFSCAQVWAQLRQPCPRVVPVSLYCIPGPLHQALRRYKDGLAAASRAHDVAVLAALLDRFLGEHATCLERRGGPWDMVTAVPSSVGRGGRHPLEAVVDLVPGLAGQHRQLLVRTPVAVGHNLADDRAFAVDQPVRGGRVLVVDDTYTSGARAQSAASSLQRAGARVTAIVAIGRVIDPAHGAHVAGWWARQSRRPFDFGRCCLEDDGPGGDRPGADRRAAGGLAGPMPAPGQRVRLASPIFACRSGPSSVNHTSTSAP